MRAHRVSDADKDDWDRRWCVLQSLLRNWSCDCNQYVRVFGENTIEHRAYLSDISVSVPFHYHNTFAVKLTPDFRTESTDNLVYQLMGTEVGPRDTPFLFVCLRRSASRGS